MTARKKTDIGKIVAQALVLLLLSGIVFGEFPEILSLTDNTSNDFTVSKTTSAVAPLARDASRPARVSDLQLTMSADDPLISRTIPQKKAEWIPSDVLTHHFILRT